MRFIGSKILLLKDIQILIEKKVSNAHSFCDVFSGTSCVGRYFKKWFEVYSNDLLYFSYILQKGTIENDRVPYFENLKLILDGKNPFDYFKSISLEEMEMLDKDKRFFQNTYAPIGGRMYITNENALRIDYIRNKIEDWKNRCIILENEYYYLLACFIEGIPFVSNISGTYGAYHKTWEKRAYKIFELYPLEIIQNNKNNKCFNEDGVELIRKIKGDILYIDPPYNSRQYLPNYHLLETAAKYDYPKVKGITGQREYENQKSAFCSKKTVDSAFLELIKNAKFKHIILSYSNDGIMDIEQIENIMKQYGKPETYYMYEISYRKYKNKKSIDGDNLKEFLFYIEK